MASSSSSAIVAGETKYKGVRKRKWGKYVSEIRLPNSRERIWLGSYDTAEKAARAFDAALFCLRGRRASFNFPDDPPEIAGGQSLSPAEIQAVAQRYGNGNNDQPVAAQPRRQEAEDGGDRAGPVDLVDCSFWDMVDGNGGGGVSDFGLFDHEPGDMCIPPHLTESWNHEEEEDGYYEHGNMHSFLWNF